MESSHVNSNGDQRELELVAKLSRPSSTASAQVAHRLVEIGCVVNSKRSGAVHFRAPTPSSVQGALHCQDVETISCVVLLRRKHVERYFAFEGATRELALARITNDILFECDWKASIAAWRSLVGVSKKYTGSFRVDARRTTKAGKNLVPSDVLTRSLGAALAEHVEFQNWRAEPRNKRGCDLVVRVRLTAHSFLVSLPAFIRIMGDRSNVAYPGCVNDNLLFDR